MENVLGFDPHSYANYDEAIVTNYDINLRVDFDRKVLQGHADIRAKLVKAGAKLSLLLDCRNLAIEKVTTLIGFPLKWTIPKTHNLGQCLSIDPPCMIWEADYEFTVRVHYSTTPDSGAIQWLEPSQTAGKKYPYCYTQCEAINARSLLPCQDTPAVKATYTIQVTCPEPLVAACSGIRRDMPVPAPSGYSTFKFEQKNPIPAYLIAIVVGDLASTSVGPRSTVYTEKEFLNSAHYEFSADTENYIKAGEAITGVKYDWGVYDMVVLPSAFPYGGMENPNLTFLSASLLTGDRSLTNVVAHEITHSWSGNYVTNASWNDFWLNEGFTVYIERLILGYVTGSEQYRHFEMLCGYNDLKKTMADLKNNPELTKLVPNLTGINPDDAFSKVPYEKGSLFLFYLETLVGGKARMQQWLNSYFTTFRNKSLDTNQMKQHFINFFKTTQDIDMSYVDWDTWLYAPGLPPFDPTTILDKTLSANCTALAEKWVKLKGDHASENDIKNFKSKQMMLFLDEIINSDVVANGKLANSVLKDMDNIYQLSKNNNVEIKFRWIQLNLKCGCCEGISLAESFLAKHGRGLYVKTLYKLLNKLDHTAAVEIYKANRAFYHSVIRCTIDDELEYTNN